MRRMGANVWRSAGPLPVGGEWKSMIRLHHGRALVTLPLHLPRDAAVPTAGVTRPERFVPDVEVMQTERRDYVPGWLWTPSALLMLAFCGAFVVAPVRWGGAFLLAPPPRPTLQEQSPPTHGERGPGSDGPSEGSRGDPPHPPLSAGQALAPRGLAPTCGFFLSSARADTSLIGHKKKSEAARRRKT